MPDVKNLISMWESRSGDSKSAPSKQKKEDPLQDPLVDTTLKHSMDDKGAAAPEKKAVLEEKVSEMTMDEKAGMVKQGFGTASEMDTARSDRKAHKRAFGPVLNDVLEYKPGQGTASEKK